jgi:L-fuculose-phosphate aldolase
MHLAILMAGAGLKGVIHTHSRYSIALACTHKALPSITVDMAAYCGKGAPLVPYLSPGTDRLADAVAKHFRVGTRALLLANHGAIFAAPEPDLLIDGAEALELAAMAYVRGCGIAAPQPIPEEEIGYLLELVYGKGRAV